MGLIIVVIVVFAAVAAFLVMSAVTPTQRTAQALDFTVKGTNSCLRFLESNVSLCHVPFTVDAHQNWQLTINCTQMPGAQAAGPNCTFTTATGTTEQRALQMHSRRGLRNSKQHTGCKQNDPRKHAFTKTFNGTTAAQSYTVFFVFPKGGQGTFHVNYKQV